MDLSNDMIKKEAKDLRIRELFKDVSKSINSENVNSRDKSLCLDSKYLEFENRRQAKAWGRKNFQHLRKDIGLQDKAILNTYQLGTRVDVNFYQRGLIHEHHNYNKVDMNTYSRYSKLISSVIKKSEIPEDIIVYRGVGKDLIGKVDKNSLESLKGRIIQEHGFMSTSLLEDVSSGFTKGVNLKIKVPKGAKGIYLPWVTECNLNYQLEMLFEKGQIMIVTDAKLDKKGNINVECQLVV